MLRSLAREMETQLELRQMLVEQQDLFEERAVLTDMIMHDASGVVAILRWSLRQLAKNIGYRMTVLAALLVLAICWLWRMRVAARGRIDDRYAAGR